MAYLTQNIIVCGAAVSIVTLAACATPEAPVPATSQPAPSSKSSELQRMAAQFAPTELTVDLSKLSAPDRGVLTKLVQASRIIDALFLRQVWEGNEAAPRAARGPTDEDARGSTAPDQQGPWSRIDHNKRLPAAFQRPEGANIGRRVEATCGSRALSAERAKATGFFTVIPAWRLSDRALQRQYPGRSLECTAPQERGPSRRRGLARFSQARRGSCQMTTTTRRRMDGTEERDQAASVV